MPRDYRLPIGVILEIIAMDIDLDQVFIKSF